MYDKRHMHILLKNTKDVPKKPVGLFPKGSLITLNDVVPMKGDINSELFRIFTKCCDGFVLYGKSCMTTYFNICLASRTQLHLVQ